MPPEAPERRMIEVVPHDPQWEADFRQEAGRLRAVFGEELVAIHHIGSTAIRGIKAKPTIDILPEVRDIHRIDALNPAMERLGYNPRGEYGIPGRRYFQFLEGVRHRFHVHVFQTGDPEIARLLGFRDYLNAHPAEAQQYSDLKEELARRFHYDPDGYTDAKTEFIRAIDKKAAEWRTSPTRNT